MEVQCASEQEHRWEYADCKDGIDWYICGNASCGETMQQYIDVGCGR